MMAGQVELAAHIEMTLVADCFLRAGQIDLHPRPIAAGLGTACGEAVGRLGLAARLRVQAARAVAGFAAGVKCIRSGGYQARVGGGREITVKLVVALFALLGADILGPRYVREFHYRTVHALTGDHRHQQEQGAGARRQAATPRGRTLANYAEVTNSHAVFGCRPLVVRLRLLSDRLSSVPGQLASSIRFAPCFGLCSTGPGSREGCERRNSSRERPGRD